MERVWSHTDDASYFPPTGEMLAGWAAIRESRQAQANLKLGGEVRTKGVKNVVGPSMAVVGSREVGSNPNTPNGAMNGNIRVTKVIHKEGAAWKLVYFYRNKLPRLAEVIT